MTAASVAAGAALLPDLDHPSSQVARCLGPVSRIAAAAVSKISGGHRAATHSMSAALAAGMLAYGIGWAGSYPTIAVTAFLVALGLAGLGLIRPGLTTTIVAVSAGALLGCTTPPLDPATFTAAIGMGYLAHLAGDCLTRQGCPLLWPAPARIRLAHLETGGPAETWLLTPLLGMAVAIGMWHRTEMTRWLPHLLQKVI